jgi:hypothetical protein
MVANNQKKLFTAFNESKSSVKYVRLSILQLEIFSPKYVIRRLLGETEYKGHPDIKYGKFSFTKIIINSEDCLAVELTFDQFNHFFSGSSYKVFTLNRKPTLTVIHKNSETPLMISEPAPHSQMVIVYNSNNIDETSKHFDISPNYRSSMTVSCMHDNASISYSFIDIFPVRSYLITSA